MKKRKGSTALFGAIALGAVVWLWVRSYAHGDGIAIFLDGGRTWGVTSLKGQILFAATDIKLGGGRAWSAQTLSTSVEEMGALSMALLDDGTGRARGTWGFAMSSQPKDFLGLQGARAGAIGLPHWVLAGLFLWPVAMWGRYRIVVMRRRKRGCCLACGYDLRGGSNTCPECGTGKPSAKPTT